MNRDGTADNDSDITALETTGLEPQTDWNNVYALFAGDGNIHTFDPNGDLLGTAGETATITNNSPTGNWRTQNLDGASGTATNRLFDGYLEASIEQGTQVSLTVDGLDEAVYAAGYDVIVYFGIEGGTRNGFVGMNGSSIPVTVTSKFGVFDTDPLDGDGINTYIFSGVTGTSFTVTAQGDTTGDRFGIAGLQITEIGSHVFLPGDVNDDSFVDEIDFGIIRDHFKQNVASRDLGDLDGDGIVSFSDYYEWRTNLPPGSSLAGLSLFSTVPEPSTLGLLATVALVVIGGRKLKCK
ncbi:PEP-CTERM sorting domain-containing protein [Aeoliella sp.]|uniref:PEP-CTERM sorting domain-containing protein n=1 Tax=Aeoliella sp. TaxID=2795800 RepID=UPI003CCC13E9